MDAGSSSTLELPRQFRQFTISEIHSATRNFDESLVIGLGGFGKVYKGTISDGENDLVVAIKRLDPTSNQGAVEFWAEVHMVSKLRHRHLVSLIGCCNDGQEMILVSEYMPHGNLEGHLFKFQSPLTWVRRLKICIGAARGLDYLHTGTGTKHGIIHRDVKSSNILLDDSWDAKISDFGLSNKLGSINQPSFYVSTLVKGRGTFGYLDPDYFFTGRLTRKSDVYAFGVVLFEALSGRQAGEISLDEEHMGIVHWAQEAIKQGFLKHIVDRHIRASILPRCLKEFGRLADRCVHTSPKKRPTMAEVVVCLESVLTLQEKASNTLHPEGMTVFGYKVPMFLSSFSGDKSGGSSFRKTIKPLSDKSHGHKGDHGPMSDSISETVADAMFEESHQLEKSPKQKIRFPSEELNPGSEPNRKLIDRESGDRTESLDEPMHVGYLEQADVLTRMRDFLHLIWFYPVKKEADLNFGSLLDKFSLLNEYIRKSKDGSYLIEILTLLQDIKEHLDDAASDMAAYIPDSLVQNRSGSVGFERTSTGQVPFTSFWSGIPEVRACAIASATHRAVSCIKDIKVKKLGIWGSGAEEVATTLKDMLELKTAFDIVLCVHIKHHSIKELMDDIEEEIHQWTERSSQTGNKNGLDQFPNCLLVVDCTDIFIDLHDPEFNLSKWFGTVQIVMTSGSQNSYCPIDMEISVQDHLLPWILFSTNVDLETVGKDSEIQQMATRLIEKCNGHLLAITLLARALRGVVDLSVWELALQEFTSQQEPSSSQLGDTSDVMVRVLRFIWSRMETLSQRCIEGFASRYIRAEFEKTSLISSWIRDGLVEDEQEGEHAFEDLISSFLLERVGDNCVRMREETRVILLAYIVSPAYRLYLKLDGSVPNQMPNVEEWDAWEIQLSNNIISELPDDPNCPILVNLFLHFNQDLIDIPITFFNNMPGLQVLDLSSTSIYCLPSSISKLTTLRELFIRHCDSLMELPPEIGALKNLKVFDSEGTQLICLPEQFGWLTKLKCLKFSLYNFADRQKQSNQSMQTMSASVLSKLIRLKELSICVDLHREWWEDEVKLIIDILPKVRNLESFRLYIPSTELLEIFMGTQNWRGSPIYQSLSNFGLVVGHLQQRLISRVPHDLHKTFVKMPKCLKYTNGEGNTKVIARALTHANALFLDRHWTVQSLSAFGLAEIEKLKFCLLAECNEMVEIVNGSFLKDFSLRSVLGSLEHLSIYYMKSLTCILNEPIDSMCLPNLKTLAIHTCPKLRTIFTQGLLESLTCLEYLIVKDCTAIKSLVSSESYQSTSTPCLPSLKKISLLHLPELVSISRGISIAQRLESLVVYNCPNLEKLPYMEAFDHIKEIKGKNEWWDALKWCEPEWTSGQPDYLANVFVSLGTNGDIVDELADAVNLLPHLSN